MKQATNEPENKYYTTNEAAAILGLGSDSLRIKIRAGAIPANKRGGRFVVSQSSIDRYLAGVPFVPKVKK